MMLLSKAMTRTDVIGFVAASGILLFLLSLFPLVAWVESWPQAPLIAAGISLLYLGVASASPVFAIQLYRGWNQVSTRVASFVRWWVSSITFHLIVRVVGRSAGTAVLKDLEAGQSFWRNRSTLTTASFSGQYNRPYRRDGQTENWVIDYIRWCFASRNGWLAFLIPFLLVLRAVSVERTAQVPENVYTLY
jgi:hypothetical protein